MKTCQIYRYSVARFAVLKATTEIFDGKITSSYEYRLTSRSGVGIINISTSKRNGCVVASFVVDLDLKIPNQQHQYCRHIQNTAAAATELIHNATLLHDDVVDDNNIKMIPIFVVFSAITDGILRI